ncbi:MAG: RNA methyltransferase [bacterium]|nr:RNA methyltransferase [bacterium]
MASTARITSTANSRVKDLVRLRNRRERDRLGLTIVEEPLVIARALAAGHPCTEVWFCPEQEAPATAELRGRITAGGVPAVEVAPTVMDRVAYRERSAGLLVVAPQVAASLADWTAPATEPALYVVLEAVEKPGNLGAVQRIADGAGAHGLVVCAGGTDLHNPNVLRASRGACFSLPTALADVDEAAAWFAAHGIVAVATSPDADLSWCDCDLAGPVAVVLGAEDTGLTAAWLARARSAVSIPMAGTGDSLNVAASAAVLLYEAVRQRRGPTPETTP